jgi:hypothetical protein
MEFNYDGSLKNAIVEAATDHEDGELIEMPGSRFKMRMPIESTGYLLAQITLSNGEPAQAHLIITKNEDEFIGAETNIPKINLEDPS